MAARLALAVTIARGRAFSRIQLSSLAVKAGDANEAVRPEAKTPKTTGGNAKQFGSCTNTTGATSGCWHVAVAGSDWISLGSRPKSLRFAATVRASVLVRPKESGRSEESRQSCCGVKLA